MMASHHPSLGNRAIPPTTPLFHGLRIGKRSTLESSTLDQAESEATSPATDINFDPLVLPAGIALPSDDPLFSGLLGRLFAHRLRGASGRNEAT